MSNLYATTKTIMATEANIKQALTIWPGKTHQDRVFVVCKTKANSVFDSLQKNEASFNKSTYLCVLF